MAKKLPTKLHYTIGDLRRDMKRLEDVVHALDDRIDGLAARIDFTQTHALRQPVTTEQAWATPPAPRWRLLNGSWPQRDGNTYPRFDTTRHKGPVSYYESYVRRSPPATE